MNILCNKFIGEIVMVLLTLNEYIIEETNTLSMDNSRKLI